MIGKYELVNEEKVERAIYGSVGAKGVHVGGVGADAAPEAILAEYDKLAGYVRVDGNKVKTGSFYDFDKRQPRTTPEVVFVFSVNGKTVEVPEGEALPLEVRAAQILEGEEAAAAETLDEAPKKKTAKK